MPEWDADVSLPAPAAAALIEAQFPSLAPASLAPFGEGFDNAAWLVNGRWLFRFPRRRIAADFMAAESRVLPRIAPHLPAPIPAPAFSGAPAGGYPYPFAGYPLIRGATACSASLTPPQRAALAAPLGRFLRALHAIPPAAYGDAPGDLIGRAEHLRRAPRLLERLDALGAQVPDPERVRGLLRSLAAAPAFDGTSEVLCHGDLYARHLIVDDDRALAGVIDWGDVHRGDRAVDLGVAFSFFPPPARPAFFDAYGAIDDATRARARFRGLHYGILLLEYGLAIGDAALERAARDALAWAPG